MVYLPRTSGHATLLWGLAARQAWRKLRRRLRAGPAYRWRYTGRTPDRVLIAPPDLRLADPQVAHDIYHGRFLLAGQVVSCGGQSPFQLDIESRSWNAALHSFGWLRHMHAAETELAAANARALVSDWVRLHGRRLGGLGWEPSVTAKRVIAWLQHSALVLQGSDYPFYRQYLKSLGVQIRYLRAVAPEMPIDEDRLRARIALAFAALSLPAPVAALRSASRNLSAELERQILPDGGHISRNPLALMELLADLLPLRQTYANQAEAPPPALVGAVERMLPALRFFRHRDGSLARFNGMGVTIQDRIAAILRHDDTGGAPLLHAPHSGYERLSLGATTVIADTGAPPAADLSHAAHAGCLSFEMSSGRAPFIVNCGVDSFGAEEFRPLARATAAHSTATVNDTSQARFNLSSRLNSLLGTPLVAGARNVACRRTDTRDSQSFLASHDGYVPSFGIFHERELLLSEGGRTLMGRDRFLRHESASAVGNPGEIAIRFHLHPDIELFHDGQGGLMLKGESTDTWIFTNEAVAPAIEESIFFAGISGPRRSRQIVLHFRASEMEEMCWRLRQVG